MRKIEQFLPPIYRTDMVKNFMASTTNQLFSEKDAENSSYYVGRKIGGLYNHKTDFYADEIRKIRDDYQLEPTFVIRDPDNGKITNSLFYEDVLNALDVNGSSVINHDKLFNSKRYSYAPPIDIDMFINYRNYYWYPEGATPIKIQESKEDIINNIYFTAITQDDFEEVELSSGMFVELTDGNVYIVDGVGRDIELVEFDYNTLNHRQSYSLSLDEDDVLIKYPKEYVTMERNAYDSNMWSRHNVWFHRDAISHTFGEGFRIDNSRRASRPIICFVKDIELFNYPSDFKGFIYNFYNEHTDATEGEIYITPSTPFIYKATSDTFVPDVVDEVVSGSRIFCKVEPFNDVELAFNYEDDVWEPVQTKFKPTQDILFNLYDSGGVSISDEFKYPKSTFDGNPLFSYKTSEDHGVFDRELNKWVVYQTDVQSSEMMFCNSMSTTYEFEGGSITNSMYKLLNTYDNERIIKFTINPYKDRPTIYVNNEALPTVLVYADTPYILDFSDLSTTGEGWFKRYNPISIEYDDNGEREVLVRGTHGLSRQSIHSVVFKDGSDYYYTDGNIEGRIVVIDKPETSYVLRTSWVESGEDTVRLYQTKIIESIAEPITIKYCPVDTNVTVMVNGIEQMPSDVTFRHNAIFVNNIEVGDYVEIFYTTNDQNVNSSDILQEPHPALTNNPYNEDVGDFAFSMIFDHMQSIIRNQEYLEGTPLSTNRFRDTLKDYSRGDVILQHDSNFPLLQYVLQDSDLNPILAINYAALEYESFKQSIIVGIEEQMRTNNITVSNVNAFVDNVLYDLNGLKVSSNPFANSYMLATYNSFVSITIDDEFKHDGILDLEPEKNTLYIYTKDGIKCLGRDYNVTVDHDQGYTYFEFITFDYDSDTEIRYYEDMNASFVPPTPTKFGLSKPYIPMILEDDTYIKTRLFVRGHDGSRSVCFTTMEEYESGYIDPRDIAILDIETRIYNGIRKEFHDQSFNIIDYRSYRPGKFRDTGIDVDVFNRIEFSQFHRWALDNFLDFRRNESFVSSDPFTYNYSSQKDIDGESLSGHWKSIYMYYYDTTRPHIMPWELLGFDIKPNWWDSEYGTDYSSNNTHMWADLEEGIVRQGNRSNVENSEYLRSTNIYRRKGLSSVLPVDEDCNLLDPVTIGICDKPDYIQAMAEWSFGDYGVVEQAWRNSSTYVFMTQIYSYIIDPLQYISKAWNTSDNIGIDVINPLKQKPHSSNYYAEGLSQWIHDYLSNRQLDTKKKLESNFNNQDIILAHKVGGYIDSDELRVYTESYNPRSTTNTTLVPIEDIEVSTHESKELKRESYSGIMIERVDDPHEVSPFVEGNVYTSGDTVIDLDTNLYYEFKGNIDLYDWMNATFYLEGRTVLFNNIAYTCKKAHRATNSLNPYNVEYWEKKKFNDKEWVLLKDKGTSKHTFFKVTGYNIYDPYFTVIKGDKFGKKKKFIAPTRDSKAVMIKTWQEGTKYNRNDIFRLPNNTVIRMSQGGIAGKEPPEGSYTISDSSVNYTSTIQQEVYQTPLLKDGKPVFENVEYGKVFKTVSDVCNFIKSYSRYLEHQGWVFDTIDERRDKLSNWDLMIEDFMIWTYDARESGSIIMLSPSAEHIKFKAPHGVPSVKRGKDNGLVVLLDNMYREINEDATNILRLNDVFSVKSLAPIYFCSVGVKEYEHAIYVNNRTVFGDVNFNPLYNIRKDRFQFRTTKTINWNGQLKADGYMIINGNIMPNFDTSVDELRFNADMEHVATNDILNKLKYHNIGFRERDYFNELEMDVKSQVSFYKGFIREKGSMNAIDRFLRNESLGNNAEIDVYEEWAFNDGRFGGVDNNQFIELTINNDEFKTNPQPLYLEYKSTFDNKSDTISYYNIDDTMRWVKSPTKLSRFDTIWDMFSEQEINNGDMFNASPLSASIPNAGHVRWDDVDYRTFSLSEITEVFEDMSAIPTIGDNMWISKSVKNDNQWDVLQAEDSNIIVTEILTVGKDEKCSFIIKTNSTVNANGVYGFYNKEHLLTFELVYIEDNYYLGRPFNKKETNILDDDISKEDLNIIYWKTCRVPENKSPLQHANDTSLTLNPHTKLYTGNSSSWEVYAVRQGGLILDRKSTKKVKTHLIDDVVIYDRNTHDVINRLQLFDPLKGIFPTNVLQYINWITTYDPANYDSGQGYTPWGKESVGKLWWDTSKVSYIDYESGSNEYRTQLWGTMFPKSKIVVNEWVKSPEPPEEDDDGSTPPYVTEKVYDSKLGIERNNYYFWKPNNPKVPENLDRRISAHEISNSIRDGHLFNGYAAIISDDAILISDSARTTQNDVVVQINYRITESTTPTHTQWSIVGETENNDKIPEYLHNKMIDSILGYDINGNRIPHGIDDYQIIDIENIHVQKNQVYSGNSKVANLTYHDGFHDTLNSIYGNGLLQGWFKNNREAKRTFVERMNSYLRKINWWDIEMFWQRDYDIPLETKYYRFVPWYSEDYTEQNIITNVVEHRNLMKLERVNDGDLIRVNEPVGRMPPTYNGGWTIYQYIESDNTYKKLAQDASTLEFTEEFIDSVLSYEDSLELRFVIETIYKHIFKNPYRDEINNIFFAMVRYVFTEQESNDWVFPTSYISLTHKSMELIQKPLFQQDKEQQIREYINEAKPYHTKLRNYERVHTAPIEDLNMHVTDFDKPPFITVDRNIINLQENLIDKLVGNGTDRVFQTVEIHHPATTVIYVNNRFVERDRYEFTGVREITFVQPPPKGVNSSKNIVVISHNNNHRPILRDFKLARGYHQVFESGMSEWLATVNQKYIGTQYDRISVYPTLRLEDIVMIYEESLAEDKPFEAFTNLSKVKSKFRFTESDRVVVKHYYDMLKEVVDESAVYIQGESDYVINNITKDNVIVLVDNKELPPIYYKAKKSGVNVKVEILLDLNTHSDIILRPRDKYEYLLERVSSVIGLGKPHKQLDVWKPSSDLIDIELDENDEKIKVDKFVYDENSDKTVDQGRLLQASERNTPEEYVGMKTKETIVMTSMNNFKLVPKNYVKYPDVDIFEAVYFVGNGSTSEVPINLNVHPDQIFVLVDNDEWILDRHFRLEEDKIVFIRRVRQGQKVVIADRIAAFDMYYDREVKGLKNINFGGFDGNVMLPDNINDRNDFREFIVQSAGKSYVFEEISSSNVTKSIEYDDLEIRMDAPLDNLSIPNNSPVLLAIHGIEYECVNGVQKVKSSKTEFVMVEKEFNHNYIKLSDRGVFSGQPKNFDLSKYNVKVYYLSIDKDLSAMVIPEPYIGNRKNHYPKYGHIVSGKDNGEC